MCFSLYVEALRVGECTGRDIKYCFELADEMDMEQVGVNEFQSNMPLPLFVCHLEALADVSLCALLGATSQK